REVAACFLAAPGILPVTAAYTGLSTAVLECGRVWISPTWRRSGTVRSSLLFRLRIQCHLPSFYLPHPPRSRPSRRPVSRRRQPRARVQAKAVTVATNLTMPETTTSTTN
ncbi:hypothetical protein CLAIMM_07565, partial [Cladophialophora immunda]